MPRIKCPNCAAIQQVEDSLKGQVCTCRVCARELRVPGPAAPPDEGSPYDPPAELPRRRRKRRKKRPAGFVSAFAYYTGTLGVFGWVLAGLVALWLCSLVAAAVWPEVGPTLLTAGSVLVLVGNVWIGFIAYQDSSVFGMLCFFTCLFTYAYIFMNLEETWRPACLTGLGFLVTISGLVVCSLTGAPGPAK